MRSSLLLAALFVGLSTGLVSLPAQTNMAPAPGATGATADAPHHNRMIDFLPQADQDRVIHAHEKAVADNPQLQKDETDLRDSLPDMQSSTPEDIQAYKEKVRTYQEKVRQAMLKEDPTLGPILDQIDKHMSEMRAKAMGGAPGQ